MKKIPTANPAEKKGGWTFGYELVSDISAATNSMPFPVGMEEVESVLIALKNEGYIDTDE